MNLVHPKNDSAGNPLELYPFQRDLLSKQLSNDSPYIYDACDMGLGKSAMSMVYANTLMDAAKVKSPMLLFVVPASLRLNTITEAKRWLMPHIKYAVISYDLLTKRKALYDEVRNTAWDLIVFDEFHYCKNLDAQRTLLAFGLFNSSRFGVRLASGTPITKSALDLFPICCAVANSLPDVETSIRELCSDRERFGNYFAYRYNSYRRGANAVEYKDIRTDHADELRKLLFQDLRLMYRLTKEEALPDLPDMHYQIVPLDLTVETSMTPEILQAFEMRYAQYESSDYDNGYATVARLLGTAIANCKDMYEHLNFYLEAKEPIIIGCAHTDVVQTIAHTLHKHKPVLYTGAQSPRQKNQAVEDFQSGKTNVFIGNIRAAGVGITLTRASHAFFVETDPLPSNVKQFGDRIRRIGQKNACVSHFFSTQNPFHIRRLENMVARQKQIEKVI